MNILITGSAGFVGKNLVESLYMIKENKDRTHPGLQINEIFEYDLGTGREKLTEYCQKADFVFNLAGVNRPEKNEEFRIGNCDFASELLQQLKACGNTCPVMLASSIQATLQGRYKGSEYGKSKLAGEELFFSYGKETGARVLVYRFPNIFGKWCRPNYNSVVATFCNNIANNLPIRVDNPQTELELVYIDDLVREMIDALEGKEHRQETAEGHGQETAGGHGQEAAEGHGQETAGRQLSEQESREYCYVPTTHKVTLGDIVYLLNSFKRQPETLLMPSIPRDSFAKKLYSAYLSYLPASGFRFPLKMNCDERGSFTEILKSADHGQLSVNISKPGITKGQHWHHSKWELFIVVSGHALIQERRIGVDEKGDPYPVLNFEVSGEKIEAVHMIPGYTHNIVNLSDTEDLVTVMWANEQFDPDHPDTYFEVVESQET